MNPPAPKAPWVELIGREAELHQLQAALDEAFAGRGSLYVLEGEAGIGKTRLAAALERIAAESGGRTAWGTCQEEAAPAYWPWQPVLARLGVAAGMSDPFALTDAICASIRTAWGDASARRQSSSSMTSSGLTRPRCGSSGSSPDSWQSCLVS